MRHQMLSNRTILSRQSCEVKMVRQKLFAILVRAISVIYDHFSIEKVNLETSDIHICPRKIVGKIFVHIGQTSSISRLIDSLSQFQEFCRSNPEICYPWTFWELSRELFVKVTCLLKIPWFIELVNIWNRRQSTEKSSKKLRVWNNVRVTPSVFFVKLSIKFVNLSNYNTIFAVR